MGKSEGKRPLGRPRRREEANIEKCHKVIKLEYVNGNHLSQCTDKWRAVKNDSKLKLRGDKTQYKVF